MKRLLVVFVALQLTSLADVPSRVISSGIETSKREGVRKEAEENYRRGLRLAEGTGGERDYAAAAKFYRKAAEAGHARAQSSLAEFYENGFGVEHDCTQAAFWYRKAAEQGDPEAQNNLGALYATGQGVPRNDAEALNWYRLAAEQNDPEGITNLGTMYLGGRVVERDFVQAFDLFQKAASQNYAAAQNNLALMYANAQGVERDYVLAYAWLDVAAEELSGCADLRDRIAAEMTPADIARARTIAKRKREELAQKSAESKP